MNIFDAMKGPGKKLLTIIRGEDQFHLLAYHDGSLGIARNFQQLGTWEPDERQACMSTLMRVTGWRDGKSLFIMRFEQDDEQAQALSAARLN